MSKILDAACGSRMFWFDKEHPEVCFADNRVGQFRLSDDRVIEVNPDLEVDFRDMPFDDESFKLVVFDPPHLVKLGETSDMAKKYGKLSKTWKNDIKKGFDECWRVLDSDGVLIFKWCTSDIKTSEVLEVIGREPLFGHKTGSTGKTKWFCFMKLRTQN